MELLSTRTYAAQPEGRFLQMAENLLSSHLVAISLRDDLFDLLRHESAYGARFYSSYTERTCPNERCCWPLWFCALRARSLPKGDNCFMTSWRCAIRSRRSSTRKRLRQLLHRRDRLGPIHQLSSSLRLGGRKAKARRRCRGVRVQSLQTPGEQGDHILRRPIGQHGSLGEHLPSVHRPPSQHLKIMLF